MVSADSPLSPDGPGYRQPRPRAKAACGRPGPPAGHRHRSSVLLPPRLATRGPCPWQVTVKASCPWQVTVRAWPALIAILSVSLVNGTRSFAVAGGGSVCFSSRSGWPPRTSLRGSLTNGAPPQWQPIYSEPWESIPSLAVNAFAWLASLPFLQLDSMNSIWRRQNCGEKCMEKVMGF